MQPRKRSTIVVWRIKLWRPGFLFRLSFRLSPFLENNNYHFVIDSTVFKISWLSAVQLSQFVNFIPSLTFFTHNALPDQVLDVEYHVKVIVDEARLQKISNLIFLDRLLKSTYEKHLFKLSLDVLQYFLLNCWPSLIMLFLLYPISVQFILPLNLRESSWEQKLMLDQGDFELAVNILIYFNITSICPSSNTPFCF